MLSDGERETLREIERGLSADDPDFERSFRADPASAPPAWRRSVYTLSIVVAAVLGTVLLLVGSLGGALAFTVAAGAVWLAMRHENDGGTPG